MLVDPKSWKYPPAKCLVCGEMVRLPRMEHPICSNCSGETRGLMIAADGHMVRRGHKDQWENTDRSPHQG